MAHLPPDWPLVFAVDASSWPRCDAETSPERGFYYSASKHSAGKPIVAGWSYQWISQLDWAPDSWTAPLDARRIPPSANPTTATIDQVRRLLTTGCPPTARCRCSSSTPATTRSRSATTLPSSGSRSWSGSARTSVPPRPAAAPGRRPRPPTAGTGHGSRYRDPAASRPAPDAQHRTTTGLRHRPRTSLARAAPQTAQQRPLGRSRHAADRDRHRDPSRGANTCPNPTVRPRRPCGCGGPGPASPTSTCAGGPTCAASTSSTPIRFAKNTLGWTTPALRTPEQADRWTWLIIAAYTQLRLARCLVADLRLPWERRREPSQTHPRPRPTRISATCRHNRHTSQATEIRQARARPTQRNPPPHEPATQRSRRPPKGLIAS